MGFFDRLRNRLGAGNPALSPESPTAQPAAIPMERRSRNRVDARRGTKVLIIDDSRTILAALRKMLQPGGYIVAEALDGETALDQARTNTPNLIFLDIVMPGMNGFATLRALRRNPHTHDIPVIMMSGNEYATEQFFGSKIPADDFMKKPFSRLEVFARIERLLDAQRVPRRRSQQVAGTAPIAARAGG